MSAPSAVVELSREGHEIAAESQRFGVNVADAEKYWGEHFPEWLDKVRKAKTEELVELSGYFVPYGPPMAFLESLRSAILAELSSRATTQIVNTMVHLDKTGARLTIASLALAIISLFATIVIGWANLQSFWHSFFGH